jgi:hypothetical protein
MDKFLVKKTVIVVVLISRNLPSDKNRMSVAQYTLNTGRMQIAGRQINNVNKHKFILS